jgi:nicotinate-nucleotide adenylyltransferase
MARPVACLTAQKNEANIASPASHNVKPTRLRPLQAAGGAGLWRGLRVGLLGGSFNPAHGGHRHISLEALRRLRLDYIWWLVSPQNPLKPTHGMAPLESRLKVAKQVARHPRIRVIHPESILGTRYTAETLHQLKALHPATRFVWIMGADNMVELPKWRQWRRIIGQVPIAVFDRPSYFMKACAGQAATAYRRRRLNATKARLLADMKPPAWAFVHMPKSGLSATRIRAAMKA